MTRNGKEWLLLPLPPPLLLLSAANSASSLALLEVRPRAWCWNWLIIQPTIAIQEIQGHVAGTGNRSCCAPHFLYSFREFKAWFIFTHLYGFCLFVFVEKDLTKDWYMWWRIYLISKLIQNTCGKYDLGLRRSPTGWFSPVAQRPQPHSLYLGSWSRPESFV